MFQDNKDRKRFLIYYIIGSVFFLFFAWHVVICYDTIPIKEDMDIPIVNAILNGFTRVENSPFDLYFTKSFLSGMGYALLLCAIVGLALFCIKRKTRFGKEHGSAEYATEAHRKKLRDEDDDKNMIFTNDVFISMNTRKTRLNNNVLVIGGSGSGKTRFVAKPNILQANCSYAITDPKGELLRSTGKVLEDEGYIIKVFNLIEKEHSCCYNPFYYIHKESDVFKLINQLIKNTNPPNNQSSADPFWEKSETALLEAIFFYLWLECPIEQQNFKSVMDLINIADASEDDESRESRLDVMFRQLGEEKGEDYIPVKQYNIYRKASGKTAKSILISVGVRLSVFNLKDIENLTITDTLHLDEIGDRKTALYIVIPDSDPSFNFLVSMMYSQLFDELYFQADFGEMKWNNDRILYHSPESLVDKKNLLINKYKEYNTSIGDLRKQELYHEIEGVLKDIENEFGLGYPKLTGKITKKMIMKHLDNIDSQLLRIRDRTGTLRRYHEGLKEVYRSLKTLYKRNGLNRYTAETKITKDMTPAQKKEIQTLVSLYKLELRLEKEYGMKHLPDTEKCLFFKMPMSSKDRLVRVNTLCENVAMLLKEMENSEISYGTKQSFDDKVKKISLLTSEIEKKERDLKTLSKRQVKEKKKLLEDIKKYRAQIKNIELIAEYEFGITDLMNRHKNGGRLPTHVRCILDEFANIAPVPDFTKLVATMRSREISVTIIIQNQAQLKTMFKDDWESITGNCDEFLFLGGQEASTLEAVSKKMGKETIDKRSQGRSKGKQGSSSENWDTLGRELMMDFEIGQLPNDECLLFVRGMPPFRSKKFILESHKRYHLMGETDNPSDPRLYDFYSKFNTLETAKGIDQNRIMMDGEYKKIIKKRVRAYIDRADIRNTFNSLTLDASTLITRNNISSVADVEYELERQRQKKELFIRQARIETANILNNMDLHIDITDESTHDTFRELVQKNTNEVLRKTASDISASTNLTGEDKKNPSFLTAHQFDRQSADSYIENQKQNQMPVNQPQEDDDEGDWEDVSVEMAVPQNDDTVTEQSDVNSENTEGQPSTVNEESNVVPLDETKRDAPSDDTTVEKVEEEKEPLHTEISQEEEALSKEEAFNQRLSEVRDLLESINVVKKYQDIYNTYCDKPKGVEQDSFHKEYQEEIQSYSIHLRSLNLRGISLDEEQKLLSEEETLLLKLKALDDSLDDSDDSSVVQQEKEDVPEVYQNPNTDDLWTDKDQRATTEDMATYLQRSYDENNNPHVQEEDNDSLSKQEDSVIPPNLEEQIREAENAVNEDILDAEEIDRIDDEEEADDMAEDDEFDMYADEYDS